MYCKNCGRKLNQISNEKQCAFCGHEVCENAVQETKKASIKTIILAIIIVLIGTGIGGGILFAKSESVMKQIESVKCEDAIKALESMTDIQKNITYKRIDSNKKLLNDCALKAMKKDFDEQTTEHLDGVISLIDYISDGIKGEKELYDKVYSYRDAYEATIGYDFEALIVCSILYEDSEDKSVKEMLINRMDEIISVLTAEEIQNEILDQLGSVVENNYSVKYENSRYMLEALSIVDKKNNTDYCQGDFKRYKEYLADEANWWKVSYEIEISEAENAKFQLCDTTEGIPVLLMKYEDDLDWEMYDSIMSSALEDVSSEYEMKKIKYNANDKMIYIQYVGDSADDEAWYAYKCTEDGLEAVEYVSKYKILDEAIYIYDDLVGDNEQPEYKKSDYQAKAKNYSSNDDIVWNTKEEMLEAIYNWKNTK